VSIAYAPDAKEMRNAMQTNEWSVRATRNPVKIRDGRATVSGEPLAVTAVIGGKTSSTRARIRESGY
jgi:hypothetical protein